MIATRIITNLGRRYLSYTRPIAHHILPEDMTEVYDDVEKRMGISAYASPNVEGFAAVLKARYSDFIVHEVGMDGEIACLDSMKNDMKEKPWVEEESSQEKRKLEEVVEKVDQVEGSNKKMKVEKESVIEEKNDEEWAAEAKLKLAEHVGDEAASGAVDMLMYWEDLRKKAQTDASTNTTFPPPSGTDDDKKNFVLPFFEEKEIRKNIHTLIRSDLYKSIALADTVDKKVRIWHISFATQMPDYGKFDRVRSDGGHGKRGGARKKKKWSPDCPDYLKFVLYKENVDTTTALKDIGRIARIGRPQNGQKRNSKGGHGGGIGYSGMKDKRGITSQFCTVYRKTPEDLMVMNRESKYQNKSGGGGSSRGGISVIRVGNFSYVDKELRLGMLQGNRFDIVLRNICVADVQQKKDENVDIIKQRLQITIEKTAKAVQALKDQGFINYFGMQRFGKFHDTHEVGICILKGDFEEACNIIMRPKKGESEDYIMLRKKWEDRFEGIDSQDAEALSEKEKESARAIRRKLGRFMNCELSIVNHLSDKPRDYKGAFNSITRTMKSMFLHAYQSFIWNKAASYRIEVGGSKDIMIGDLVFVKEESVDAALDRNGRAKAVKCVTKEDVESGRYNIEDVVLPLVGPKIQYPQNTIGEFYDKTLAENDVTKNSFVEIKSNDFVSTGDYRLLMCKPDIEFQVKLYNEPKQPLVMTDLMKIKNDTLECVQVDGNDIGDEQLKDQKIIGGIIAMTLPSSAYATIALRELMKRPTIQNYQAKLLLEGNAEENMIQKVG